MVLRKDFYWWLLLLSLPMFFLFFFGRYGLEDSDSGLIVGLGWRIFNGEAPYKDFYYIRPIISPLVSAVWLSILPEYGQVVIMRLINYYQLLIQVSLTIFLLKKNYNFKTLKANPYVLILVSFLITSIGTPYFQWHTTDGVFFAVIGFFLIGYFDKKNKANFFIAGLFLGISALTKQNFIIVPLLGLIFTFLHFGFKKMTFVLIGVTAIFIAFYYYLSGNNLFNDFLIQNTGSLTFKDLFFSGFVVYLIGVDYFFPIIFLMILIFIFFNKFKLISENNWSLLFLSFVISVICINFTIVVFGKASIVAFDKIVSVFVVLFFVCLFLIKKEKINQHYLLIALLGVSWASSISWGAMSPLIFFTPLVFSVFYLLQKYLYAFEKNITVIFIVIIIFYSCAVNLRPYRDSFVWNINDDASLISKKLAFIKSRSVVIEKHLELKAIFKRYMDSTILPSMPGAYYLHNKINKLPVDWAMDAEIAFDKLGLIDKTDKCCSFYIVEKKSVGQPIGEHGKFYSSITEHVLNKYKLIDSSYEYFDIYVNE